MLALTSTLPRWAGDGGPRFVLDLHRAVAAHGVRTTVLAPRSRGALAHETLEGIDVRRFRYALRTDGERLAVPGGMLANARTSIAARWQVPGFLLGELFAARRLARAIRVDVIHAHWALPQGLVGALVARERQVPLVVSTHGSDVFSLQDRVSRALRDLTFREAACITVNSETLRARVLREHPSIRQKVRLLPMGIDLDVFRHPGDRAERAGGPILFVGRLIEQKGAHVVLRAVAHLRSRRHVPPVEIVGDGPRRAELQALAAALGLDRMVSFVGPRSHTDLAARYGRASVCVVPSSGDPESTEALGLVALEALACGCPVIATTTGELPHLLGGGAHGALVPPDDPVALAAALDEHLTAPQRLEALAEQARPGLCATFDWRRIGALLARVYASVRTAGRPRGAPGRAQRASERSDLPHVPASP